MPKLGQSSGTVQFTTYCKSQIFSDSLAYARSKIPYPRERGPMGGAPLGLDWGMGRYSRYQCRS